MTSCTIFSHRRLPPLAAQPKFPSVPYTVAASYFADYVEEMVQAWKSIDFAELDRAAAILSDAYARRAAVYSCGNGGSASIANHLVCDHLKGIRTRTDLVPRVISLSSNVELLTAIANDIGYEDVFAYQLAVPGGARRRAGGHLFVGPLGQHRPSARPGPATTACTRLPSRGSRAARPGRLADVAMHCHCANYGIVEDLHQAVMHALAQYIRQSRMTTKTISATVF